MIRRSPFARFFLGERDTLDLRVAGFIKCGGHFTHLENVVGPRFFSASFFFLTLRRKSRSRANDQLVVLKKKY